MTDSTGPMRAPRPPTSSPRTIPPRTAASSPRIIPPRLRRLAAGAWLAAALASTAGAASASAGAIPYSVADIGPAPAAGFKISDIGAIPTPGHHSPGTTDAPADGVEVGDINSR